MHRLHVNAIERLTHAALPQMIQRHKGNIINVSSVAGFLAYPLNVSYCATKAWINSFTEGLYIELKAIHSPVRIQALCPGLTYSEFHDRMGMDRSAIPRSLWMSAEDVVDASLRSLKRDELFVVPGWRYRFFVRLYPWVPRGTEAPPRYQIRKVASEIRQLIAWRGEPPALPWWLLFLPNFEIDRLRGSARLVLLIPDR